MLWLLLLLPLASAAWAYREKNLNRLSLVAAGVPLVSLAIAVLGQGAKNGLLELDGVGFFYLVLADLIFTLVALYARGYWAASHDTRAPAFFAPFFAFIFTTHGAYLTHNLGLMWIFVESSTLASAFLVYHHHNSRALEATWKYLMLGSVGIALGLIGVILVYAVLGGATLDWGEAKGLIGGVNPAGLKLAFAFLLIGFGTKVGLFPMHAWLPDAHSESPSPGSALLSGTLLNVAFYALVRYTSLLESAGLGSYVHKLLLGFGLASVFAAALFLIAQKDYKRLLAYSSMEHMGLGVYALGLGAPWLALLHTLFHSLCKTAAFLSAGNLSLAFGSTDIDKASGSARSWPAAGFAFVLAGLALAGLPPFPLFFAEFQALLLSPAALMPFYLLGLGLAFAGLAGAITQIGFGTPSALQVLPRARILVWVPAALLLLALVLGVLPPAEWAKNIAEVLR